jgi:hypothetical protein
MILTAPSLGPHERLLLLRAITMPAVLPPSGLVALAELADERIFDAGDVLVDPEQPVNQVHIVVEGRVTVTERQRRLYTAEPRQVVGVIEGLARMERGCLATADERTLTLTVPMAAILDVYEDHFEMYLGVLEPFAGVGRWHDAVAETAVSGLTMATERFVDLLEDDFQLAADLLAAVATEVRAMLWERGERGRIA